MSKKLSSLASGAGAGLALGSTIGSFGGPIGTGIGAAVGGIAGGLYGLVSGGRQDEEDAKDQAAAAQAAQDDANEARLDAYKRYMLGVAADNGANPALLARKRYELGLADIDKQSSAQQDSIAADGAEKFDPMTFAPLAAGLAQTSQKVYNQFNAQPKIDPTSPEVQKQFDADDWAPIRRGTRQGFGGATY